MHVGLQQGGRDTLDPVFLDFADLRKNQKSRFEGEFFPAECRADQHGRTFIDFFQVEKYTGAKKGIIEIVLSKEDIMSQLEVWYDSQ